MTKVYNNSDDLQVRAVYVYKKADDAYAYSDSAKTAKIEAVDLKDLFVKGLLMVVDGDTLCQPISFTIADTVGTVSYCKDNNTVLTLKSEEYTA